MTDLMGRGPLGQKTPKAKKKPKGMRRVSKKRAVYRASQEGQEAVAYMGQVKQLPCVICGAPPPSIAHHCFHGRYGTRKTSDFDTIPLCSKHHDSWQPDGVHAIKEEWAARYGPDYGFIEQTRKLLLP